MSNTSPGPWTYTTREKTSLIFSAGREPVAKVCINSDGSRLANTNLIAAAPDLLNALQAVANALEWHEDRMPKGQDSGALDLARAAIAKAKVA